MISIFEPDEFAQYSIPRDMLTPQDTFKHSLYNFIAYDHYYYGYPFYLSSILATLPVSLTAGLTNKNTQITMLLLRQLVSVLPMLLAVGLLVFTLTKFRKPFLSFLLAGFILTMPAVVENNLWWHPDSLVLVFIITTFSALIMDQFRLGKYFWLSAIACGLAVGTKVLGFFFFLTIPTYLVLTFRQRHHSFKHVVLSAIGFVVLMFITIIISNPYLLIPSEFNQLVQIMTRQSLAQSAGWTVQYARGPASWLPIITRLYGSLPFWILISLCLGFTIWNKASRTWGWLLLSWVIPLSIYILFFTAIKPTHFLLPVAVPLVGVVIQPYLAGDTKMSLDKRVHQSILGILSIMLFVQAGINIKTDIQIYTDKLNREKENPIVQFYTQFSNQYGSNLNNKERIEVLRDVRAYFPYSGNIRVNEFYNTLTLKQLQKKKPDLLILWNQRIKDYTSPKSAAKSIDPQSFQEIEQFFQAAKDNQIPGYHLLMENSEIKAFAEDGFALDHSLLPSP